MPSIDDLIKQEINPFDRINLRVGNFFEEQQDSSLIVASIHQEAIREIEGLLDLVVQDHRSRTILLTGDSGCGKTYLLGRLKRKLNPQAFFVYIGPWASNDYIWRHTLRCTVNSLMKVPEGQKDSQLMLWLKNLSAFTKRNLKQKLFVDNFWKILENGRKSFISHLKKTYKTAGIYNPDTFFGVLHSLTNSDLYDSACEWLRGDDLSEEAMQELKVKHCIDSEDAAKNILANFGKITTETQPIVLCFDQIDYELLVDPQPFFSVNTTIHNDCLKNFLIIISITTSDWRKSKDRIPQSDTARFEREIQLRRITLEQAEALWTYHLKSLHKKANPKPTSPIFPLTKHLLEQEFHGKTDPRNALITGRDEYQKYKISLIERNTPTDPGTDIPEDPPPPIFFPPSEDEKNQAELNVRWQEEYRKTEKKITKISLLSGPDLIQMLQRALTALGMQNVKPKFLSGVFAGYSLTYQQLGKPETVGIVWTEDASAQSFFNVMNACQRAIAKNSNLTLLLLRMAVDENPKRVGYQIYKQIFHGHPRHHHFRTTLRSVHYLATYNSLVNSALAHDLVIAGKSISLTELESLIRKSKILQRCPLLQDLKVVQQASDESVGNEIQDGKEDNEKTSDPKSNKGSQIIKVNKRESDPTNENSQAKEFVLNLVITQQFMGLQAVVQTVQHQFPKIKKSDIDRLIQELCQEKQLEISDPQAKPEAQLIFWLPKAELMPKKAERPK